MDLQYEKLEIDYELDKVSYDESGKTKASSGPRVEAKKKKKFITETIVEDPKGYNDTYDLLQNDDFKQMRSGYKPDFFKKWEKGFKLYLDGEWAEAYEYFKQTRDMIIGGKPDGPSMTLMNVIEKSEMKKPDNWKGYRPLTEK